MVIIEFLGLMATVAIGLLAWKAANAASRAAQTSADVALRTERRQQTPSFAVTFRYVKDGFPFGDRYLLDVQLTGSIDLDSMLVEILTPDLRFREDNDVEPEWSGPPRKARWTKPLAIGDVAHWDVTPYDEGFVVAETAVFRIIASGGGDTWTVLATGQVPDVMRDRP